MRIGVIGAGQLGRMLALAGHPLGMKFMFLDPTAQSPAADLGELHVAAFDDPSALRVLADQVDQLTFEFENVPAAGLAGLPEAAALLPPVAALRCAQDRLREKRLFAELDIATGPSRPVDDESGLQAAVEELGLPAVLKTRRLGYDGKGQALLREKPDLQAAWGRLGGQPSLLEAFVPFDYEVSLVAVRGRDGEIAHYPLTCNRHEDGILRNSVAPWEDADLGAQARRAVRLILEHFDYVGVLTVEFFVFEGRLLANEIAPRVHNSGHWTIEGAETSQFENHLRAIAGWPLGSTAPRGHSAMVNFIGELPSAAKVLAVPRAHLHDYGKTPRPGRKLGHATVLEEAPRARDAGLQRLLALIG
jgi:5-(carboxyamino)imidazole ribonucleotide synthase